MTKTLACGCVIGLYSQIEKWCDRHYQQLLDERYKDDEGPSLSWRVLDEEETYRWLQSIEQERDHHG